MVQTLSRGLSTRDAFVRLLHCFPSYHPRPLLLAQALAALDLLAVTNLINYFGKQDKVRRVPPRPPRRAPYDATPRRAATTRFLPPIRRSTKYALSRSS